MGVKRKKRKSVSLNNREKMLICNHEGVFSAASEEAFAKLFGVSPSDLRWDISPANVIKARDKLRKEMKR